MPLPEIKTRQNQGKPVLNTAQQQMQRSFLQKVRDGFPDFLNRAAKENPLKAEYFLPSVVSSMIEQDGARVKVMTSRDRWYGVTYPQDKQTVVQAFEQMSEQGLYQPLWQE